MGIYGMAHELQQGGDVPVVYDNSAEYWDACDEVEEFTCDMCGEWKVVDDDQPVLVKDPTVDVIVLCAKCYEGDN